MLTRTRRRFVGGRNKLKKLEKLVKLERTEYEYEPEIAEAERTGQAEKQTTNYCGIPNSVFSRDQT